MIASTLAHFRPIALMAFSAVACAEKPAVHEPIRVAAASDLSRAFEEISREFERESGQKVSLTFGSSGLLARQIREGAPFDLFAAANVAFVDDVVRAGACDGATKKGYARGHIAIWSKAGGSIRPAESLEELAHARFRRIAIANPDHAPYGAAAREALRRAGVWEAIEPRLVYGENVRQALQFAQSGNAEAAIVALSLVVGSKEGSYRLVEANRHDPIEQALVVCKRGKKSALAKSFAEYLDSNAARTIMKRHGFSLPGER